jgi:hypothetical protein
MKLEQQMYLARARSQLAGGGPVHYAKKQMKVLMNNNCEL